MNLLEQLARLGFGPVEVAGNIQHLQRDAGRGFKLRVCADDGGFPANDGEVLVGLVGPNDLIYAHGLFNAAGLARLLALHP